MKVSELAQAGGVTPETVRHYTREGLLHPQRDPQNGYQRYDNESLSRLCFIQCFRMLGFSLGEIKGLLGEAMQESVSCSKSQDILANQLPQVRLRIRELQALSARMDQAMQAWQASPGGVPTGHLVSHLLDDLSQPVIV
ncbi:DNA-binding transcriptional MerR regulator [Modicisalibacter xianhensis]|uniref:DNA-binding transcriptional MerR regulator n=1 Tax=Modicisalibacter xianhensis TaxID=442341 RepID=A0A4R8G678_9GAMM|nr:MerR family transcriptional regulator [Halomonas xianhensis]TDX31658.1 DNA-binding transcriptional MerR regulator [Halomonas xianhensis]